MSHTSERDPSGAGWREHVVKMLIGLIVLVLLVLAAGSHWALGRNNPDKVVDHYTHSVTQTSPRPVYVTKSFVVPYQIPKEYQVDHVHRAARQKRPYRPRAAELAEMLGRGEVITDIWCARTTADVTAWGWAILGYHKLFWGDINIRQCWGFDHRGVKVNRFFDWKITYTCGTTPNTLWTCDSSASPDQVVRGSGYSSAPGHVGWLYRYRRAYWRFHYAYSGFPVTARPFAAVTVRADGSYVVGKGDS